MELLRVRGNEELVRAWKDHNMDSRLMHHKIDLIASKLGISFYSPNMQRVETGDTSKRKSQSGDLKQGEAEKMKLTTLDSTSVEDRYQNPV